MSMRLVPELAYGLRASRAVIKVSATLVPKCVGVALSADPLPRKPIMERLGMAEGVPLSKMGSRFPREVDLAVKNARVIISRARLVAARAAMPFSGCGVYKADAPMARSGAYQPRQADNPIRKPRSR